MWVAIFELSTHSITFIGGHSLNIYNDSKYTRWYYSIINAAKSQSRSKLTDYFEAHHIIPNSISENKDVVLLTAREHYICHLLLTKMCILPDHRRKMTDAFWLMVLRFGHKSNRIYEYAKKLQAKNMSVRRRGKSSWNKGKSLSDSHRASLKANHKGNTGRKFSKEHKEKLGQAKSGSKNHNYGKQLSPETRLKMSIAQRKRYENKTAWEKGKKKGALRPFS